FGKLISIQEVYPNYMLDYQERPEAKTETRWIDRVTLDGSWSGNVFDFYSKVIKKLTADLKIPFKLDGDKRVDNTPVHDALREALVNTIVHADYSGKASILVVKRPDMFGFRNPGLMRVSIEQAISGYEHDCRNERLHQMFHFIGLGERAGSGIPNIFKWWNEKHWRPPYLHERMEPYDQTLFELRMADLIDDKIILELKNIFGETFDELDNTERLILVMALGEKTVTHSRVKEICTEHNYDLSQTLHRLVQKEMLVSSGYGQGTVYHLPTIELISPDDVFGDYSIIDSGALGVSSGALGVSSGGMGVSSGGYVVNGLEFPIYDKLDNMHASALKELQEIAKPASLKPKLPKEEMERIVIELCGEKYLSFACLVGLLNRSEDYVRKDILNQMVTSQKLLRAFPKTPNDPRQAYTSTNKSGK
ncbi:MAG TPA: ATP-binding protein, partial [Campylobacterales bacterium]|nr:ATP-binding protein [Campylobacterales bacterium]